MVMIFTVKIKSEINHEHHDNQRSNKIRFFLNHRIFFISVFLFASLVINCHAQYHAGIGVRAAKFNSGLTMKYFFGADNATGISLLIAHSKISDGGWVISPIYENQLPFHIPLIQLPLDFIAGMGMHIGYYPAKYYKIVDGLPSYYKNNTITVGVDALIAFEYQIPIDWLPLAIGIEAQPFFEFINKGPEFLDFGATLKYVFVE
jgi:hypothetical protein